MAVDRLCKRILTPIFYDTNRNPNPNHQPNHETFPRHTTPMTHHPTEIIIAGIGTALADTAGNLTGDDWISRILGPLGALVFCVIVIVVLAKDIVATRNQAVTEREKKDAENKEHQSLLLSLVREASANTARLTEKLSEIAT